MKSLKIPKVVIGSRKQKTDRQYNGQNKLTYIATKIFR